ncbi:MAG: bifunctional 4-hydroxy-2-oxoglutarate aldolase/2-dehydro-3-deoxy-phosphogluconate aldolase [Solobacterium sp.]|nr:bifunctional 4-hydroxy-2-oxoglutarate aldolase/2-dehydro-3-deoxy-phosphogluconate aldolase [Solobacterium sp.]
MNQLNEAIAKIGVVPVIKLTNPERDAAPLAKALCEGGLPAAEVTFRAAGADKAIRIMKETCPEMIVGAGTVLTVEQAQKAFDAGAQFIVSPGFSKDVADKCVELGVQYFPGVTTPTEYQMALPYGYEVIKFFPAEQSGGLAKIKAMSAPFPMFKVMPTGGISLKNLEEYLSCPVIAACGGSYMVKADDIESQNWDKIIGLCRQTREIVDRVRG